MTVAEAQGPGTRGLEITTTLESERLCWREGRENDSAGVGPRLRSQVGDVDPAVSITVTFIIIPAAKVRGHVIH